jgi:hypothetical protein
MCVELVAMVNWIERSVDFSAFKNHSTTELGGLSRWQGDEKSVCAWKFKDEVCRDRTSVILDRLGGANLQTEPPCASPNPCRNQLWPHVKATSVPDHTHYTFTEVSLVNQARPWRSKLFFPFPGPTPAKISVHA